MKHDLYFYTDTEINPNQKVRRVGKYVLFSLMRMSTNRGFLPYVVELPGRFTFRTPYFTAVDYKRVSRACNKTLHRSLGNRLIRLPEGFRYEDAYRDGVHFTPFFSATDC